MAANDDSCIFCKIVRGDAPANKVYEDEDTLAIMDIFPVTDGHTLIITKEHFSDIFSADAESLRAVAATAKRVAHAIDDTLAPDGMMVFQLNRAAAGQTVFHYHMHLLPRWPDQPLQLVSRVAGDPARLEELARRFAQRLAPPAA